MNFFTRKNRLSIMVSCVVSVAAVSPAWSQECDPLEGGEGCGDATGSITQPADSPAFRVPTAGSFTASMPLVNTQFSNWFGIVIKKPTFGLSRGSGEPDLVSLPTGNAPPPVVAVATTGGAAGAGASGSVASSGPGERTAGNTEAGSPLTVESQATGKAKNSSGSADSSPYKLYDGGVGIWVQSYGDFQRNDIGRNGSGSQLSRTGGILAGLEWLSLDGGGNGYAFRIGGGYNYTALSFSGSDPDESIAGGTIVSFLGISKGDLVLSTLGKIDFFNFDVDTVGGTSLANYSVAVNAEYDVLNYTYHHAYITSGPIASVQYGYTDFADSAARFSLRNGESVRVEGGWQVSTTVADRGIIYTALASATAYSDVVVDGYSFTPVSGAYASLGEADEGQVLGHLNLAVGADFRDGLTAFLNFGLRGGGDMVGGDAAVNVAYRW